VPGPAGQRRADRLVPGDGADERVEHHAPARAAGVDDARVAEHGQLAGGGLQRGQRTVGGGPDHLGERRAPGTDRGRRRLRAGPGDGQEGPLLGVGDGGVGRAGGPGQGGGEGAAVDDGGAGQRVGQPAQELGEDRPGVAPRTQDRAPGQHRPG
jgi:hypothetical protein